MISTLIVQLGWTLLHFIWQGAVIAGVAGAAMVALRNSSPQSRYALACGALFICLAWPGADLMARLSAPSAAPGAAAALAFGHGAGVLPASALLDWVEHHLGALVLAWATGTGVLALRLAAGLWWVGRAAQSPRGDATWQARLSGMATRFGITRAVRLRIVDGIASPVTAGWWRPVVLLPASLLSGMPPDLLEALIAHELGHVRRADYLVNLLQNIVEMLLFYHPAVWWLSRRIRVERERIADALAAQHVGERRLARALSELEKSQFGQPGLALGANGGELMSRIERLLRPAPQGWHWKAVLPVLGLSVALAAVGAQGPATIVAPLTTRALVQFASCASPAYPQQSLRDGHTGQVGLAFLVGTDGKVLDARVEHSSGHVLLDDAARLAIARCTFTPAMENGVAVAGWTPLQYTWVRD